MREEKGQALIIIAISFVVLAGFVGLAIDGGQLYTNRRKVQNGSDAAALAGTRLLATYIGECRPGSSPNDAAIRNAVIEYARLNGVDYFAPEGDIEAWYVNENETQLANVGAGSIPNGTTGVEVSLTLTATTSFMRLLGIDHMTANADAMAMTGPVVELGGGVLPIGVFDKVVEEVYYAGEHLSIFDDETTLCGGKECHVEGKIPTSLHGYLNLGFVFNKDPNVPDRAIKKDVGSSGCGSSDDPRTFVLETGLRGWATKDCDYPYAIIAGRQRTVETLFDDGDYIHGEPGTVASTLAEIGSSYPKGSTVVLPVFDYVYAPGTMAAVFADETPAIGWATGGGGSNAVYHHIVGYVAARIHEVKATGNPKYITTSIQKYAILPGNIAPGNGVNMGTCMAQPQIIGVILWR